MTIKTKRKVISRVKRKHNPEGFKPGFYYRTSSIESDFPIGPTLIYVGFDGSVYSIDLKSYRFFKNIDGKNRNSVEKFVNAANDSYWDLFVEPIKNEKLLSMLVRLRDNNKIL